MLGQIGLIITGYACSASNVRNKNDASNTSNVRTTGMPCVCTQIVGTWERCFEKVGKERGNNWGEIILNEVGIRGSPTNNFALGMQIMQVIQVMKVILAHL